MEVVPVSVGAASRAWDEQHLELAAAAGQVGGAPTGGFTDAVAGPAARFATTWGRHVEGLAEEAEGRADALRRVILDFLATDRAVAGEVLALAGYLEELR